MLNSPAVENSISPSSEMVVPLLAHCGHHTRPAALGRPLVRRLPLVRRAKWPSRTRCITVTSQAKLPGMLGDVSKLTKAVFAASEMYNKFDSDGNGELSLQETVQLLSSADYRNRLQETLGVDVPERTEEDIKALFHKLDADNSGALSQTEFVMLWLALARERSKAEPRVVALAFCRFLDADGDGKVTAKEIKRFLPLLGPGGLALGAVPVPGWMAFDYEKFLAKADDKR